MKAKRLIAMLLALAMCFALMAGCGGNNTSGNDSGASDGGASAGPDSLVVRINGDPKTFNPTLMSDDNLYKAAQNMYHRLTCLDASKQVIPDAAESWDISDDALTITFHLKDGIKWWDGEALDAEDVKYTFDYALRRCWSVELV